MADVASLARGSGPGATSLVPDGAVPPFRVPVAPTPIIGRNHELAALAALLAQDDVRLVTLTGTGGVGKTRLALEAAGRLGAQRAAGAAFVSLAALRDAAFVPTAVAHALGVRAEATQGVDAVLLAYLAGKQLLLLLDNFEQVMAATAWLTNVLATGSSLQVMVTSRTALRVRGEREFPVQPLALPPPASSRSIATLAQTPAVDLFVRRARAVRPDFALTSADATAVTTIVRRLDGLPLAIELAAARVKTLSPPDLLARLGRPLDMLVDGARDLPLRQQTLRRTLAWSYELLDPREQALFRRLAVFSGGSDLAAIERVCSGEDVAAPAVLDLLTRLIDHSLVQADLRPTASRYWLLETTLAFAGERLEQAGEMARTRRQHGEWCLALAEQAESELVGPRPRVWLERLQRERHNLRAALAWCREFDAEMGLRLAVALQPYWEQRGLFAEGRRIMHDFLALAAVSDDSDVSLTVPKARPGRLTRRELEVSALVARGCTSRQIARTLRIAEGTAALHVEHVREKLGVHSRAEIATWAVRHGLLAEPAN